MPLERGPKVQAGAFYNAPLPKYDPIKRDHLWIITGMWRVADPSQAASGEFVLDLENLITLNGPGCLHCEQIWTPELQALPCMGVAR